jgi:hypothetical protein
METMSRVREAMAYAGQFGITTSLAISEDNYTVVGARNKAVATFLRTDATHLMFVDCDVLIQEDAVVLLAAMDKDIACGCYPSTKAPKGVEHMFIPYITITRNDRWLSAWFDGILEVQAGGTGCMLIKREVLETLGWQWFQWPFWLDKRGDLKHHSDDVDFCMRAREAGFKIFAHGNVRCGHMKRVDIASFIFEKGKKRVEVGWQGPTTLAEQARWPAYGSHVPALCSLAESFKIETVLEYGGGDFSTSAFLNRRMFPDLTSLRTLENKEVWFEMLAERHFREHRFKLKLCPLDKMALAAAPDNDLILIDCDDHGDTADDGTWMPDYSVRCQLIKAYEETCCIVVVHDSEEAPIAEAIADANYQYKTEYVPEYGPPTAVMSNRYDVTTITWGDFPRKVIVDAPTTASRTS